MRPEPFRLFLLGTYRGPRTGQPLPEAPTSNAVSRCRRIEKVLGLDLDMHLKAGVSPEMFLRHVENAVESFRIHGDERAG